MDIKYFVRTTGRRKLDQSYEQIDYKLLCYNSGNPIDDFIQSLYDISDFDSVLLEDDLILCEDFDTEVKKVLDKYKGRIVNFFQAPTIRIDIRETASIVYNQCTFYPKGISKKIADSMSTQPRVPDAKGINFYSVDRYSAIEHKALVELRLKVIQYRPHLVQHLSLDTHLRGYTPALMKRGRSQFFIDYYKKLGIEEPYTFEKTKRYYWKLVHLSDEHFKEIDKNKDKYFN